MNVKMLVLGSGQPLRSALRLPPQPINVVGTPHGAQEDYCLCGRCVREAVQQGIVPCDWDKHQQRQFQG